MKYTEENYKNAKINDTFEFVCQKCGKTFVKTKREIQRNGGKTFKCCSLACGRTIGDLGEIEVSCAECGRKKIIKVSEYNKSDNKIFFCNRSCAAKYNNKKISLEEQQTLSKKVQSNFTKMEEILENLQQIASMGKGGAGRGTIANNLSKGQK